MRDENYQCTYCGCSMDHPVDFCPICQEPFFWLVLTERQAEANELEAYLKGMIELQPEDVDRAFLTHGGHLWLPGSFWLHCPDGHLLENFPWIKGYRLVQHPKAGSGEAAAKGADGPQTRQQAAADIVVVDEPEKTRIALEPAAGDSSLVVIDDKPLFAQPAETPVTLDTQDSDVITVVDVPEGREAEPAVSLDGMTIAGAAVDVIQPEIEPEPAALQTAVDPNQEPYAFEDTRPDFIPPMEMDAFSEMERELGPDEPEAGEKPKAAPPAPPISARIPSSGRSTPGAFSVFLFFVFLSLAYMTLLYHQRQSPPPSVGSEQEVIQDEN